MVIKQDFVYYDGLDSVIHSAPPPLCKTLLRALDNFTWSNGPKTLLCHDHRGGYLDFESVNGAPLCEEGIGAEDEREFIPFFAFFHWWHIDIFVYFSHHFLTLPPVTWIRTAHKHGVIILGTFIIENEALCQQVLASREIIDLLIARMVDFCVAFKFDGWLINIESKLTLAHQLNNLEYFLSRLTDETHTKVHKYAQIIWYDSLTHDGALNWQNALNTSNLRWFKNVDGFYTNYAWKEEHILQTLDTLFTLDNEFANTNKTLFDVYIGIDVFGRGCPGGGGWNCIEPLEIIRRHSLSAAIFAPGWICENFPGRDHQCLFDNTFRFWHPLRAHMYSHRRLTNKSFRTDFGVGFQSEQHPWMMVCDNDNQRTYRDGAAAASNSNNNHFCILNSALQPFYLCSAALGKDIGAGLLITGKGVHDLFLCNIPIDEMDQQLGLRYTCSHAIAFIVTIGRKGDDMNKILHLCRPAADDDDDDGRSAPCEQKCIAFDVSAKFGWNVLKIALWNKQTSQVRLYAFEFNLLTSGTDGWSSSSPILERMNDVIPDQ